MGPVFVCIFDPSDMQGHYSQLLLGKWQLGIRPWAWRLAEL